VISVGVSTLIVLALRAIVLFAHGRSGAAGQAIAHHTLRQLSWFIRVSFQAFAAALFKYVSKGFSALESDKCRKEEDDPCGRAAGDAFLVDVVVFLLFFTAAVRLLRHLRTRPAFSSVQASQAIFLGECACT
jgi:hypothetical protein